MGDVVKMRTRLVEVWGKIGEITGTSGWVDKISPSGEKKFRGAPSAQLDSPKVREREHSGVRTGDKEGRNPNVAKNIGCVERKGGRS